MRRFHSFTSVDNMSIHCSAYVSVWDVCINHGSTKQASPIRSLRCNVTFYTNDTRNNNNQLKMPGLGSCCNTSVCNRVSNMPF